MKKVSTVEYILDRGNLSEEWKDYSFVVLSDYHNNEYNVDNEEIFAKIETVNPQMIIVAGDMVTAKPGVDNSKAYSFVKSLADKYHIYYANGNHEYRMKIYPDTYPGMYDEFLENIKHHNITHLVNDMITLEKGSTSLNIRGLQMDRRFYKRFERTPMEVNYIASEIGEASDSDYEVLIAHNPNYFEEYVKWGADLVVSGHVHGGIVRLPFLGGVISTDFRLFPKYDYGLFEKDGSRMILTSGIGTHTIKFRLFNPVEIVSVRFK